MEFPPNNEKAKAKAQQEPKKVERVTSADAIRRKKPLGKQFKETFFGGDGRTALQYVMVSVAIPAIKDLLAEMGQAAIEKIIFGDTRAGRRRYGPPAGAQGYVSYNRMHTRDPADDRPPVPQSISRRARARHNFDEIILNSRSEAEEVIDRLFDIVSRFDTASVSDLYELVGLELSHTDHKWGWTDMRGASVERVRSGGYLLDLPEPEPLS
jgi:hypothetical protein